LNKIGFVRSGSERLKSLVGIDLKSMLDPLLETPIKKETHGQSKSAEHSPLRVFTADTLATFDGSTASQPVYLSLLGEVFDVEKGRKHYAGGGGYSFFAGRDATRAFVTGDFSPSGLTDDVSGLSDAEILQIADWLTFYGKEYKAVGFLAGTYYDDGGRPTVRRKEVDRMIEKAKEQKATQLKESEVFPFCNSEWRKDGGGRVWCTTKSGGVERSWTGVPRKLFDPTTKNYRCACVKNFGSSLVNPDVDGNRGDLDHPNLRNYEDCPASANSCKLP